MSEPLLYTRRTAAALLSVSVRSIDHLLQRGDILPTRIGGRVLIPATECARIAQQGIQQPVGSR